MAKSKVSTPVKGGMVYQGTPQEIITDIGEQITSVLNEGGVHATGIHAIALLHTAASLIKDIRASSDMGLPPSFATVLQVVTRGISGSKWTVEELHEFNKDFCAIVESLGGQNMGPRPERNEVTIMGPSLGVH